MTVSFGCDDDADDDDADYDGKVYSYWLTMTEHEICSLEMKEEEQVM